MKLFSSNIKKLALIFSQKKTFLIFWATKLRKNPECFLRSRISPSRGGGLGDHPPHYSKNCLVPSMSPHCFDPKMPILSFSCSFWPFCPNPPSTLVDPIWETQRSTINFYFLKKYNFFSQHIMMESLKEEKIIKDIRKLD